MKKNNWIYKVFLLTFILSVVFSGISNFIANNFNNIFLLIITIVVIIIGIIFDMIGVAVLTSKESTFHAKASKKIKGAKESINLIKNSATIASFCNDVIGDICGIISGSLSAVLTLSIAGVINLNSTIIAIFVTAITSTLTVGGKAIMKRVAMKNSDSIVFIVGKIKSFLHF